MGIVEKYGGTSVATLEQLKKIAWHVKELKEQGEQVVIVASAMGKTTNELLRLAHLVNENINARELDSLLSTGEQQTITLLALFMNSLDIPAISLTGSQCGILTSNIHTSASIMDIDLTKIQHHLNEDKVVIVAGFQGVTRQGDITTLGRGGSDTTAVAIAAKLGWNCHIYTDVDGVYTLDPRICPNAAHIHKITYREMMQMAQLGSGVLETRSVELASKFNVKVFLGRALEQDESKGTWIMDDERKNLEAMPITGISVKRNYTVIAIEKIPTETTIVQRIMEIIALLNINLEYVSQQKNADNTISISLLCDKKQVERITSYQTKMQSKYPISYKENMAKISLIGIGIASHSGVAAKSMKVLNKQGIKYEMVSTSELSLTYIIHENDLEVASKAFVEKFDLQADHNMNGFTVSYRDHSQNNKYLYRQV